MRVLHVQKVAGMAGSENHLLTLLPRLAQRGIQPTMLVLADGRDRPEPFIEAMRARGVAAERFRMRGDADPLLLARLARYIARERFPLVHTHLLHGDLYGRVAARMAGARVVTSYHCDDPFHLIPGVRQMDRITALACDRVICISHAVRDFVANRIGVPERLLTVVHYGMEAGGNGGPPAAVRASLGLPADTPLVGIVGRLTEQKGHADLLEAFGRVAAAHPRVRLVVAGDGELRGALEERARVLGIADRTHFLGFRADAPALMKEFDVVAVPSLFEGFGLVLLEAMLAGRPVVATAVSAIPEIVVDGETGLLVPPRDPAALAGALLRLIEDPAAARRLGERGRARLEACFTVEKMVSGVAAVYRQVAPPPRP